MKYIAVFIFLLTTIAWSRPEDVYLSDGRMYKNVIILDSIKSILHFKMNNQIDSVRVSDVAWIDTVSYDSSLTSFLTSYRKSVLEERLHPEKAIHINTQSSGYSSTKINSGLFVMGIVSFGFAWDFLADASDIPSGIDDLESIKTRKTVLGIVSIIGGIACIASSFETVGISATGNTLSVAYFFDR